MTTKRRSESGQATVEYVAVAVALVVALMGLSAAGQQACTKNLSGGVTAADCKTLPGALGVVLKKSIEEITFLINLPF